MWVLISLIIFLICLFYFKKPHLYPPGPPSFPFIGNVLSVWWNLKRLKHHHAVWQRWSQHYGDILGLRLGCMNLVVISGLDRIKEVASRDVFDGRPSGFIYTFRSFGKNSGIVFSDGSVWSATRRVVLKYLKNFGYGSQSMESYIYEESKELVNIIFEQCAKPIAVNDLFNITVVNILWRIVAGRRYDLKDARLRNLCHLIARSFRVVDMSGGLLNFFPWLRYVIPNLIGYTELRDIHDKIHIFIKDTINEHRGSIDVKQPRDVIDAFLIEMLKDKTNTFSDEDLHVVCRDLLEAGMETVSNTSVYLMLHVLLNKDVQARLHREIDQVIGSNTPPILAHRNSMVYTEAVLLETLRISSVAAVGIPHVALHDAQLGNYIIPKGTTILLALYDLHNGRHWTDPHSFRPERFITSDGNLVQDEWLMPFGAGRRRCIGERLARSELFLFLTHILQKFELHIPEGDPVPSTEIINGITLTTKPYRILFKPRY